MCLNLYHKFFQFQWWRQRIIKNDNLKSLRQLKRDERANKQKIAKFMMWTFLCIQQLRDTHRTTLVSIHRKIIYVFGDKTVILNFWLNDSNDWLRWKTSQKSKWKIEFSIFIICWFCYRSMLVMLTDIGCEIVVFTVHKQVGWEKEIIWEHKSA